MIAIVVYDMSGYIFGDQFGYRNSVQFVRIFYQSVRNSGKSAVFNDQFSIYYKEFGFNSEKSTPTTCASSPSSSRNVLRSSYLFALRRMSLGMLLVVFSCLSVSKGASSSFP